MPLFKALPTGTIVGDTDTQTLTNKTITSPTFSGTPTIPGTGGFGKFKVVTTTYNLTTATGTQTITGAGFTPKGVMVLANVFNTTGWSSGFSDGAGGNSCIMGCTDTTTVIDNGSTCVFYTNAATTTAQSATMTFNSDGGVLSWTKTGSPTGTLQLFFLFFA